MFKDVEACLHFPTLESERNLGEEARVQIVMRSEVSVDCIALEKAKLGGAPLPLETCGEGSQRRGV